MFRSWPLGELWSSNTLYCTLTCPCIPYAFDREWFHKISKCISSRAGSDWLGLGSPHARPESNNCTALLHLPCPSYGYSYSSSSYRASRKKNAVFLLSTTAEMASTPPQTFPYRNSQSFTLKTPPPPPPKPVSSSGRGTPASPPPFQDASSNYGSTSGSQSLQQTRSYVQHNPDPGAQWLPKILEDKRSVKAL
jgi:hypothetical protein